MTSVDRPRKFELFGDDEDEESWLAEAPKGTKVAKPATPASSADKEAMALELQLELIDLQLALDCGDAPVPKPAVAAPAKPVKVKPTSRRAAKRLEKRSRGVAAGRVVHKPRAGRAPTIPKHLPETGSALHDSLIGRDWAAALSNLDVSAAGKIACGCNAASISRNGGRGANLYPLHLALMYGAPESLVLQILKGYPLATRQPATISGASVHGKNLLPLHVALMVRAEPQIVTHMLASYPPAVSAVCSGYRNFSGLLPLHLALLLGDAPSSLIRQILNANRDAVRNRCTKSAGSADLASFGGRLSAEPGAPQTFLPIHLAAMAAASQVTLRLLLAAWPESVAELAARASTGARFSNGFVAEACPLHLAIAVGVRRAPERSVETVQTILTAMTKVARESCVTDIVNGDRQLTRHIRQPPNRSPHIVGRLLPIHLALIHRAPENVANLLLQVWPQSARSALEPRYSAEDCDLESAHYNTTRVVFALETGPVKDHLPLHLAVLNGAPASVVAALLKCAPETAQMTCRPFYDVDCEGARGCLALHLALFKRTPPDVVQALLSVHPAAAGASLEGGIRGLAGVLPIHVALMMGAPLETLFAVLRAHPDGAHATCWLRQWEHRVTPVSIARDKVSSFPKPDGGEGLYLWRPSHGRPFDKVAAVNAIKLFDFIALHVECDVVAIVSALEFFGLESLCDTELDAVRVFQYWVLRWVYLRRFTRLKAFTLVLQCRARRTVARNRFVQQRTLFITMQSKRRGILKRRTFLTLRGAAIQAQSVRRGVCAQKARVDRLAASRSMQRILRGAIHRQRYLNKQRGVSQIALVVRARQLQRRMLAATVIQSMRRAQAPRQDFVAQKRASLVVQCAYRWAQATHRVRVMRVAYKAIREPLTQQAALLMQRFIRVLLTKRLVVKLRLSESVTIIQATVRRRQAVREVTGRALVDRVFQSHATFSIQRYARGFLARCHRKRLESATQIQNSRRRHVAKRELLTLQLVDAVFTKSHGRYAATTVQRHIRGVAGRRTAVAAKVEFKENRRRTHAATRLQCNARTRAAEKVVVARRVVNVAWDSALKTYMACTIQCAARQLIARRRKQEAIDAREQRQRTVRGSSLIEVIIAIRSELGLEATLKPREVIATASEYLGVEVDAGASLLQQAQEVAEELGIDVQRSRAKPLVLGGQQVSEEPEEIERDARKLAEAELLQEAKLARSAELEAIDFLLWESDAAHTWWWQVSGPDALLEPPEYTETLDPRTEWTGRDAYGYLIPYNGWKQSDAPPGLRELLDHLPKLRISDLDALIIPTAYSMQGRKDEIDAIALTAKLMDLDIPKDHFKPFLKGIEFLLFKAGRSDSSPSQLGRLLEPFGFKQMQVDKLFMGIEWISRERSRLMETYNALHEAEKARRAAEDARLARLERERQAWLRAMAALQTLNATEDVILDEALKRLYVSLESRPQAMATFTEFDTEGSGFLSHAQYEASFDKLHLQLSDQQTKLVLAVLDQDKSGRISIEDFCDLVYVVKLDRLNRRFQQAELRSAEWLRRREAAEAEAAAKEARLAQRKQALEQELESGGYVDPVVEALNRQKEQGKLVPPKLKGLVDSLPYFDEPNFLYILKATVLRLQGRATLINLEDLFDALAECAREPCLSACEFLLKKALRPDADPKFLTEMLTSIGFSEMNLRVLFEAMAWLQDGAEGRVVAPKREAAEAEADRLQKIDFQAKVESEVQQRIEDEVAKRTADLIPKLQAEAAHEAALQAMTTGAVPTAAAAAAAPAAAAVATAPEPEPEPLADELQALGTQLEHLDKLAFLRLSEIVLLEELERTDEAADTLDGFLQCLAEAGIEPTAAVVGPLQVSATHLLKMAQAQKDQAGDIKALQRQLAKQGFARHHLRALAEMLAWRSDEAPVFEQPSKRVQEDGVDDRDEQQDDWEEGEAVAAAPQKEAVEVVSTKRVTAQDVAAAEPVTPPPELATVITTVPWLDLPAWKFTLQAALMRMAGMEAKVDKVTLRQTLNECDVEGKDQDLYMASCVQLMKMLAEGHPDVAGIKLLGMKLSVEFVNVALEVGDSAASISADAVAQRALNVKQEEKRIKSQGMVSDLFGGDDWIPDNTASKKKPAATATAKQAKKKVSSSLFDDSDDDDDFDFNFDGSGSKIAAVAAPKLVSSSSSAVSKSIFADGDDSDDDGGAVSAVFQKKKPAVATKPKAAFASGGGGLFDDEDDALPVPPVKAKPSSSRPAAPAPPPPPSPPPPPPALPAAAPAPVGGKSAAMVALEQQLAREKSIAKGNTSKSKSKSKSGTSSSSKHEKKSSKEKEREKEKDKKKSGGSSSKKKPAKSAI